MSAPKLPPLPKHRCLSTFVPSPSLGTVSIYGMHPDDVHAYGLACYRAALEQVAKVCENSWPEMHKYWGEGQARAACQENADTIRRLAKEITP